LAGTKQEIRVVALFPDPAVRKLLEEAGAKTVDCDLMDPEAVAKLEWAPNVVYMVGMKFGTSENPTITWAVNAMIPAYVGRKFVGSRIVAFSTACVYPLVPVKGPHSLESDPLMPLGEYSNSCVARERVLEHFSRTKGTKMVQERLSYSVDLRYGVLVDIATQIRNGEAVDLTMGYANVIWQGDVNAMTLRLLEKATSPALAVNLSGPKVISIREAALGLARRMKCEVKLTGKEADTALLIDCSKMVELVGEPEMPLEKMLDWVADWVSRGGKLLGKPTHFQTRDGKY